MEFLRMETPVGELLITVSDGAVTCVRFSSEGHLSKDPGRTLDQSLARRHSPLLERAAGELKAYFAGTLRSFSLPLAPEGTVFQKQVWSVLCSIHYGDTCSYKDVATAVGNPNACRAIGGAVNKNPIGIIIPCHRVIGKSGSLTGYAGGLDKKEFLLSLEKGGQTS